MLKSTVMTREGGDEEVEEECGGIMGCSVACPLHLDTADDVLLVV